MGQRPVCRVCSWTRWGGRLDEACVWRALGGLPEKLWAQPVCPFRTLVLCPRKMNDPSQRHLHPPCHRCHDTSHPPIWSLKPRVVCPTSPDVTKHAQDVSPREARCSSQQTPVPGSQLVPADTKVGVRQDLSANPRRPWERLHLLSEECLKRDQGRIFYFDLQEAELKGNRWGPFDHQGAP